MKIAVNTLFMIPGKVGGTETYARGVLSALNNIGQANDYLIFCNKENFYTFNFTAENFRKIQAPVKATIRPLRLLWEQIILPLQLLINRVDVVLSLGYIGPLFVPCKSAVVIFDLNWFFHPEEFTFLSRLLWKILVTLSAKRANLIITSSMNSKNDIVTILNVPPKKVLVVYGGIDRARFRKINNSVLIKKLKRKYKIYDKFILTASAAYKFKNLANLIEAFRIISSDLKKLQLVIVGLGGKGKPEIINKINKYKLNKKVLVAGWVKDEDIPLLYSSAETYVHPSLYEGFGFPVLEAMSCGCPVISSESASLPELVGKAGIIIDAKKSENIANAIKEVVSNRKLRNKLIKDGFQNAAKYDWSISAKKILNNLETLK